MSDQLYGYYERELSFIRQFTQEFAHRYPAVAGRLLLEPDQSVDPHVERMIESFALISGRIRHKLDDEFPELTDALLGVLYPHYLAPVPSMAIVQFEPDPKAQLPTGFAIERQSRLHTQPVDDLPCKYRTGYPVTLWPLRVASARLAPPPFPPGSDPPPGAVALLRIGLECLGGLTFADLSLQRLRLYLNGEGPTVSSLYELLFQHVLRVDFRPVGSGTLPAAVSIAPGDALHQVGFERDDGLLPYPNASFLGYRLLTEFFAFPEKFRFLDLDGFGEVGRAGYPEKLEVHLFVSESSPTLEQGITAATFRLGCTPVVNLFPQTAEPIALTQARSEYRITPDVANPTGMEVYSVDSVTSVDPLSAKTTTYHPFYSFRHRTGRDHERAFWYASRTPAVGEDDRGTDVALSLVDLGFSPRVPPASTLVVWTTCTNRDLPIRFQHAGERVDFTPEFAAPPGRIHCLRPPTPPLRLPPRREAYWRLISHLCLNHLSLTGDAEGLEALKEILRLYDFFDPRASESMAAVNRQLIDGITAISSRRVVRRVGEPGEPGFCRGTEVTLEFDEQKYLGTGVLLFACVLERFLALYASINSFTQLVVRTRRGEGEYRRWPPRAGELQML